MAKKLFVGNLDWSMTEEDLKQLFEPYGVVETETEKVLIIKDKFTQKSKGFGFVTVENADEAVSKVHNSDVKGRKIVVNEARPLKPRAPRDNY